jgi:hypothetical protein
LGQKIFFEAGSMMVILEKPITLHQLKTLAERSFGDLVKAVVDVERELIALDADLHSDLESLLLENGSSQENLWGINFYPALPENDFVEFDSMINMRPSQGNMSRGVDDQKLRQKIVAITSKWIQP